MTYVECERHGEKQRDDRSCSLSIRQSCDTQMRESTRVDEELDEIEQYQALAYRALDANNGVVVGCEDQDAHDDLIRNFHNHVGNEECFPGVGLAGAFTNFVKSALGDE